MLAELLRVPHASVRTTPLSASWSRRHALGPALDQLRVCCGLPPDPDVQSPFRYLQLVFGPPGFCPPADAPAPTTHVLRPTIFDRSAGDFLPEWVHELPDRSTVYVTLGTVLDDPRLLGSVMRVLSLDDANVIVTVGRERDQDRLMPPPQNAHVCTYIPQSLLLPHCDVVVAHGGYNTIVGCIDVGVPMLLLPVRGDLAEDSAWRAETGIARVLPLGQQSSLLIRQAVRDLLEDPSYRRRAAAVRQAMHQQP